MMREATVRGESQLCDLDTFKPYTNVSFGARTFHDHRNYELTRQTCGGCAVNASV